MHAPRSVTTGAGLALVLAIGLAAGCGDDGPSTEEATAELCDARDDLGDEIAGTDRLDPRDVDELNDAREELADDVDELSSAGQEVADSAWEDVERATEQLQEAVGSIDADTSFCEAADRLGSAQDADAPELWGFLFGDRMHLISQVVDGWTSEEHKYLEVCVQGGRRFMLRQDAFTEDWTASALIRA